MFTQPPPLYTLPCSTAAHRQMTIKLPSWDLNRVLPADIAAGNDRFWKLVLLEYDSRISGNWHSFCWLWQGKTKGELAFFHARGKVYTVWAFAWWTFQDLPRGPEIPRPRDTCASEWCVRPDHLVLWPPRTTRHDHGNGAKRAQLLANLGWEVKRIAAHMGLHERTVQKFLLPEAFSKTGVTPTDPKMTQQVAVKLPYEDSP